MNSVAVKCKLRNFRCMVSLCYYNSWSHLFGWLNYSISSSEPSTATVKQTDTSQKRTGKPQLKLKTQKIWDFRDQNLLYTNPKEFPENSVGCVARGGTADVLWLWGFELKPEVRTSLIGDKFQPLFSKAGENSAFQWDFWLWSVLKAYVSWGVLILSNYNLIYMYVPSYSNMF